MKTCTGEITNGNLLKQLLEVIKTENERTRKELNDEIKTVRL